MFSGIIGTPFVKVSEASFTENKSVKVSENFQVNPTNTIIKDISPARPKTVTNPISYSKPAVEPGERANTLEKYLRPKGSYLADYASLIVELSDKYGVDYRLVVAIAGVESGYCRINFKPYNCWGYGRFSWASPEEGIRGYFDQMNKNYFSKGRKTPETIAKIYNPWPEHYVEKVYYHWNRI